MSAKEKLTLTLLKMLGAQPMTAAQQKQQVFLNAGVQYDFNYLEDNPLGAVIAGIYRFPTEPMDMVMEYDYMDTFSPYCQTALDIFAEETALEDELRGGVVVWVESKDKELRNLLNKELGRLGIMESAYDIVREMAKYDRIYRLILYKEGKIDKLIPVHPNRVRPKRVGGQFIGYESRDIQSLGVKPLLYPDYFTPFEVFEFSMSSVRSKIPRSLLFQSIIPWRELAMIEMSILIYRLNKSIQRRIFTIDVGDANLAEAEELRKRYMKLMTKKNLFNPAQDDFKSVYNPQHFLEDIYFPKRPGSSSEIDVLDTNPNIGDAVDLEYFKRRLRMALGIPREYIEGSGGERYGTVQFSSRESLSMQDLRFGRKVMRIQRRFKDCVKKLCYIILATNGRIPNPSEFKIKMNRASVLLELKQLDIMDRRLTTTTNMAMYLANYGQVDKDLAGQLLVEVGGMRSQDVNKWISKLKPMPQMGPDGQPLPGGEGGAAGPPPPPTPSTPVGQTPAEPPYMGGESVKPELEPYCDTVLLEKIVESAKKIIPQLNSTGDQYLEESSLKTGRPADKDEE